MLPDQPARPWQSDASDAFDAALLADDPMALYDRAPCGYLTTTPDGIVVKANATLLTWTGYTADELVGRPITDLLTAGGRIYHETHYAPLLRLQGSVRELALELRRRDGGRISVLLNATMDRDESGIPRVVRVAVFDATERRHYERELLRAAESAQESRAAAERARADAEAAEDHMRNLVQTLQGTLVPRSFPDVAGLAMAGRFEPAGIGQEVGGDFYDVFVVDEDECWAVLGDVMGKGVEAAVVTSLVRHAAHAIVLSAEEDDRQPGLVLGHLDRLVAGHDSGRLCTAVVVRLRRGAGGTWRCTIGSGGHLPAITARAGGTQQVEVYGRLLGAFPGGAFDQQELELDRGDGLLLYTDGITEGRGESGMYGEQRLLVVAGRPYDDVHDWVTAVVEDALEFQDSVPRDDIACLGLRVLGD